jgi:hypothetical protein
MSFGGPRPASGSIALFHFCKLGACAVSLLLCGAGLVRAQQVSLGGDVNCDGAVDYADIGPLTAAISQTAFDGCDPLHADCNLDGAVSYADINPFVSAVNAAKHVAVSVSSEWLPDDGIWRVTFTPTPLEGGTFVGFMWEFLDPMRSGYPADPNDPDNFDTEPVTYDYQIDDPNDVGDFPFKVYVIVSYSRAQHPTVYTLPAVLVPVGACCVTNQVYSDLPRAACEQLSGRWLGLGSVAGPNSCVPPPVPVGACCFVDGTCQVLTEAACNAGSGAWKGADVTCAAANCPQPPAPTGACCFADGNCQVLTEAACDAGSGAWKGADVTCAGANCPQPPQGLFAEFNVEQLSFDAFANNRVWAPIEPDESGAIVVPRGMRVRLNATVSSPDAVWYAWTWDGNTFAYGGDFLRTFTTEVSFNLGVTVWDSSGDSRHVEHPVVVRGMRNLGSTPTVPNFTPTLITTLGNQVWGATVTGKLGVAFVADPNSLPQPRLLPLASAVAITGLAAVDAGFVCVSHGAVSGVDIHRAPANESGVNAAATPSYTLQLASMGVGGAYDLAAAGNMLYVRTQTPRSVQVYELGGTGAPVRRAVISDEVTRLWLLQDDLLVVQLYNTQTLRFYDVRNPQAPVRAFDDLTITPGYISNVVPGVTRHNFLVCFSGSAYRARLYEVVYSADDPTDAIGVSAPAQVSNNFASAGLFADRIVAPDSISTYLLREFGAYNPSSTTEAYVIDSVDGNVGGTYVAAGWSGSGFVRVRAPANMRFVAIQTAGGGYWVYAP